MTSGQVPEIQLPSLPKGLHWTLSHNEYLTKVRLMIIEDGRPKATVEVDIGPASVMARNINSEAKALVERLEMFSDTKHLLGL